MTGINRRAPVTGSRQIEIAAPPALAWDVLTAIDRWPNWNSEIKTVAIDGAVDERTKFRWKSGAGHDHVHDPGRRTAVSHRLDRHDLRDQGDPCPHA